ncbi:glycoside hydrolase family 3 protein [Anaerotardibacter muris]|uniref:glycoside hydrolase family 3 protein n=1 Tax=Anaerotardibacter muris TaxID=2941505 RepID=UPI00203B953E|nr:glycoside hydrolase family 3 N-terminal domain-containing protein [Anaerotardibacter muris]
MGFSGNKTGAWRSSECNVDLNLTASSSAVSRRSFLGLAGGAALGVVGLSLFGCSSRDEAAAEEDYLGLATKDRSLSDLDRQVDELIESLSDREKLCQLFVVTPETLMDVKGAVTQAGEATQQALETFPVGGVVYFAKNLANEAQASAMLNGTFDSSIAASGIPPFLCVDEEGGTVVRIAGKSGFSAENVGNMADIGATGDPAQAQEAAEYIGGYLRDLGFNTDFAPVCDVANNPESNTMRKRSFGSDPEQVAKMVAAQVMGFTDTGVLCSAKHFPGIGAAVGDSHDERIFYNGTLEQLEETELVPFKAAIEAGVPLVMVGHLSLPEVVGDETPACLSSAIVTDLLRNQLNFKGIAISDSLQMDAIADFYSTDEACVMALQAGCDLLLMPDSLSAALAALEAALEDGTVTWDQVHTALRRILRIKLAYLDQ